MRNKFKGIVSFSHNGVKYTKFDATRPYFVVRDGRLISCHENYNDASRIAPYNGSNLAGKLGGPPMTTSAIGLHRQGITNPLADQ